jgi:DedD protein
LKKSNMDKALKQRLVGASVLIALAVVVLPMLLSGQPDNQQETRSIEVPPKPSELSFETRRFPVGDQTNGQPSIAESTTGPEVSSGPPAETGKELSLPVQSDESSVEPESRVASQPDPVEVQVLPPEPESAPELIEDEIQKPGRYLVQVASFSTTANANRLSSRLKVDGLDVIMDTIEAAVGILHRVRVGPYDQIEQANDAMTLIRSRTPDVNPRVIDLRPDESAPVTDPSDPLVRWVVQVGSFENQANAENLVVQLRSTGFSAYTIAVTENSRTRYKVRVGPEIERQSAVSIAADIRNKLRLDGMVISVD